MDAGNVWRQRLGFAVVLVAAGASLPADEPPARETPAAVASPAATSLASPLPSGEIVAAHRDGRAPGQWRLARADDLERPAVVPAYLVSDEPAVDAEAQPAPGCRKPLRGEGSPNADLHPTGVGAILRF